MALSTSILSDDITWLKNRMYSAINKDEHAYYADLLNNEMQRRSGYDANRDMMRSALTTANLIGGVHTIGTISNSSINTAPIPVQNITDPLSFLKNANTKLLLTGELT